MLTIFYGTDRVKVRQALNNALAKTAKGVSVVRISDAHTLDDISSVLMGGGMFATPRVVVFEYILSRDDMREMMENSLQILGESTEQFYWIEEKIDAATKKMLAKFASLEVFDLPKKNAAATTIFAVANALKRGDKKQLWISYQQQLYAGDAPEAIHGVLFWAGKDMLVKSGTETEKKRARTIVAQLAELPHKARRRGEELEYALERFVLS
ncbi:MAG: hypothetical protein JWO50_383 [Candidatus Kaiserbacteria bacterium]|nr:hypothetical protein [Candidatus Kaiserbacteria bacterium]